MLYCQQFPTVVLQALRQLRAKIVSSCFICFIFSNVSSIWPLEEWPNTKAPNWCKVKVVFGAPQQQSFWFHDACIKKASQSLPYSLRGFDL